ncbi:MAG: response regulator [Betaproteobacteria bacterium]
MPASEAPKVLVVEDDEATAEYLKRLLTTCGYAVEVAHSCQEAIEAARRFDPEVILCDIGLPDGEGYVVGSILRQYAQRRCARMIAVTGRAGPQNRMRALAAGFDQHMEKPVDPRALLREMQVRR